MGASKAQQVSRLVNMRWVRLVLLLCRPASLWEARIANGDPVRSGHLTRPSASGHLLRAATWYERPLGTSGHLVRAPLGTSGHLVRAATWYERPLGTSGHLVRAAT